MMSFALLGPVLSASSASSSAPNLFYGCLTPEAKALPYCDLSLPTAARAQDLLSRLNMSEKIAQLSPTKPPYCVRRQPCCSQEALTPALPSLLSARAARLRRGATLRRPILPVACRCTDG